MYDELKHYKKKRIVNKVPLKVLDAPSLQNDYYLNVIDWSPDNIISVGLGANVYLWNGTNCRVTKLCDVGIVDTVCSVSWSLKDPILAVGSSNG
jgi:cell division cycle 20-like protein 1 (cofactor of APC complex)